MMIAATMGAPFSPLMDQRADIILQAPAVQIKYIIHISFFFVLIM